MKTAVYLHTKIIGNIMIKRRRKPKYLAIRIIINRAILRIPYLKGILVVTPF